MSFPTPEIAIARHPGVILAPRELRGWSADLPLGNPPRAAQLVLEQLRLLVRDPDPGARFSALLQTHREPITRLLDIVTERLSENREHAVPMDQLEHTLSELLAEMAYAHLRIANSELAAGKAEPATALYQAMEALDTAFNIERLHYRARDLDKWRLMLTIFLYAEQHAIDAEAIGIPPRAADDPGDIRGLFFRALVIGLCDPHHHRPGDILRWHRWLGTHTDDLALSVLPQGPLSIPIDISGRLEPLTGARRGRPGPDMRYLAAEEFLDTLRADHAAPGDLYIALDELIRGRKTPDQRASPRKERRLAFRLQHGLRQVQRRLVELASGTGPGDQTAAALDAMQINQSRNGAAFALSSAVDPPLAIGEILLAEADNPNSGATVGFVGRIQRLVSTTSGSIEIGVEKLPGRLIPVTLSGAAAERARGDTHGLLQQHPESGDFRLLAVPAIFRENDKIVAEGVNARFNLRMRELESVTRRLAYIDVDVGD